MVEVDISNQEREIPISQFLKMDNGYNTCLTCNEIHLDQSTKKGEYVTRTRFKDMLTRELAYRKAQLTVGNYEPGTKQGKRPTYVWIVKPNVTPTPIKPVPAPVYSSGDWGLIEKGTHQIISTLTVMTNEVIKHCGYSFYLNGQKNLPREIQALINSFNGIDDGENCVDYAQACTHLAREKGYGATVYGIWCAVSKVNHAVVHITGKEFVNRTCVINGKTYPGVIMDWAKLSSSGGTINQHWCDMNTATKEPSWIPYE
jgi:hypothetical protein